MIRVLLADDHALVRAGLTKLLEGAADLSVVGAAADGREAIDLASTAQPDVVLMDLSMPDVDGIEATRRIVADCPGVQVVVLTSFSDRDRILAALDAGAVGYLLKDAEPEELLRGVRAAARGESPVDPRAARTVITARSQPSNPSKLSTRETDVLALVAEGLPNKLIARRLGISEKTVKGYLTGIFQRIGVTDRTQAALWAHRHGVARH
jgi:DNA-binding NarL/FixJ family response regulator